MHRNNKIALVLISIILVLIIQIVITRFPVLFFKKKITFHNISIYSNSGLDTMGLKNILENSNYRLKKSPYYNEENVNVIICGNKWLYSFLTPFNYKGLATNYTRYDNIFVGSIDVSNNVSKSFFNSYNENLDKLLTHEIVHSFLSKNKMDKIPKWINEGYCEYIAYNNKNSLSNDLKKFETEDDIYSKYRLLITYLIRNKKMTLREVIESNLDEKIIFKEIKKKLNVLDDI